MLREAGSRGKRVGGGQGEGRGDFERTVPRRQFLGKTQGKRLAAFLRTLNMTQADHHAGTTTAPSPLNIGDWPALLKDGDRPALLPAATSASRPSRASMAASHSELPMKASANSAVWPSRSALVVRWTIHSAMLLPSASMAPSTVGTCGLRK